MSLLFKTKCAQSLCTNDLHIKPSHSVSDENLSYIVSPMKKSPGGHTTCDRSSYRAKNKNKMPCTTCTSYEYSYRVIGYPEKNSPLLVHVPKRQQRIVSVKTNCQEKLPGCCPFVPCPALSVLFRIFLFYPLPFLNFLCPCVALLFFFLFSIVLFCPRGFVFVDRL